MRIPTLNVRFPPSPDLQDVKSWAEVWGLGEEPERAKTRHRRRAVKATPARPASYRQRPLTVPARVCFRAKSPLKRPNVAFPASAPYAVFRRPQPGCDVALPCVHDVLSTAGAPKRIPHHYPKDRAEKKQRPEKRCEGDADKEKDSRTGEERIIPAHIGLPLRVRHAYRDQRALTTLRRPSAPDPSRT